MEEATGEEEAKMTEVPSTAHFILVHGGCHGAWCWYKIRGLLENSGNRVTCVDLAGAGIHPTDPNTIFTFDVYNKPLIDLISALPEAETELEKQSRMVEFNFGLGSENRPTGILCRKEYQREFLYHMSPEEDLMLASMLLRPAPCRATGEVHFEGGAAIDAVPRVFIKTTCDKIMHPDRQDQLINGWPPSQVYTIESDHSPFFSAPTQLFNLILRAQKELL